MQTAVELYSAIIATFNFNKSQEWFQTFLPVVQLNTIK